MWNSNCPLVHFVPSMAGRLGNRGRVQQPVEHLPGLLHLVADNLPVYHPTSQLEVTVPVARAVNPVSGTNCEGTGVVADVEDGADKAFNTAYGLALEAVGRSPAGLC